MARTYQIDALWDLLREALAREDPALRDADLGLVVKEIPGEGPKVVGLLVAEAGDDLDALERDFQAV